MGSITKSYILRKENTAQEDLELVGKIGKNVYCESGFKVYNGHKNISIGNNVYLTDVLINAGDKTGTVTISDYVFFGHKVMILARAHDYNKFNLERQMSILEGPITIGEGVWIGSGAIILSNVKIGKKCSDRGWISGNKRC